MLNLLAQNLPTDFGSDFGSGSIPTIETTTTGLENTTNMANLLTAGGAFAALAAYASVAIILGLAVYIYMAIALMTIAKKTNTPNGWLAFIPIANLYLMTQIAQVPWWTMLIILAGFIPFIGSLAILGVSVWWWWKIAERVNQPGWLGVLMIVPVANLVIPGLLAWSNKPIAPTTAAPKAAN